MTTTGRDHTGKFSRTIDSVERDAEAARLHARGRTYDSIAQELGYTDRANARRAVQRVLADTVAPAADEVRKAQLEQLDHLSEAAFAVLEADHVVVSQGKVMRNDDDTPMADDGPVLAAIDRILKIQERRAKLLGLDAPTRSQVQVITEDAVDAEIERLSRELLNVDDG